MTQKTFRPHGRIVRRLFCALCFMTTRDPTFFLLLFFFGGCWANTWVGHKWQWYSKNNHNNRTLDWLAGQQVASCMKSWVSDFGLWMSANGLSVEVKELSSEGSRSKAKDKALHLLWWPPILFHIDAMLYLCNLYIRQKRIRKPYNSRLYFHAYSYEKQDPITWNSPTV